MLTKTETRLRLASKANRDFGRLTNVTTRSSELRNKSEQLRGRFVALAMSTIVTGPCRFFRFREGAIESRRDTAVAVAQIFSVTYQKFRPLAGLAPYQHKNRRQSDGTTRAVVGARTLGQRGSRDASAA